MKVFDQQRTALDKVPVEFLIEVALRSFYTSVLVFTSLKTIGRRGVRQTSLFEALIILTLGSAVGDVASYNDVPLLPVLVIFTTLALLYRGIMRLMGHSGKLKDLLEGKPIMVAEKGQLAWEKLHAENVTESELSMELQVNSVEQFGRVRLTIPEINGQISVFYYPDEEVRVGLPILPTLCTARYTATPREGIYARIRRSIVMAMQVGEKRICSRYTGAEWSKASRTKRFT